MDETLRREVKNLKHENEHLSEKLNTKNEENDQLMDEIKSLRKNVDNQFNEILSLKSQLSSMFMSGGKDTETSRAKEMKDLVVNSGKNKKPMALLIGTSNVNGIKEDKLTSDVNVTKVTAFTLDETKNVIINSSCIPDVVVLHSLTNDVRNISPEKCAEKLQGVVEVIKQKWKDVHTIISLTTPREDNKLHKVNCEILDGIIKRHYMEYPGVHNSDNENMWHGHLPTIELLNPNDKFHLSPKGTSILASNMKRAIHTILKIDSNSKGYTNKYRNSYRSSYNNQEKHFQVNNRNNYYRSSVSWNHQYQDDNYNRQLRKSPNYFR